MPGSVTSPAKIGVPSTLSGVSSLGAGVPISRHWEGDLSSTSTGMGRRAAPPASSPYRNDLLVAGWSTRLAAAWQVSTGTRHREAASAMSIVRAWAPALRR